MNPNDEQFWSNTGFIPEEGQKVRIPDSLDPRKRMVQIVRAKWAILFAFVALLIVLKTVAFRYYEPINTYVNSVSVVRDAKSKVTGFTPKDIRRQDNILVPESQIKIRTVLEKYGTDAGDRVKLPRRKAEEGGGVIWSELFTFVKGNDVPLEITVFNYYNVGLIVAVFVASGLILLPMAKMYGQWRDPADAFRDWCVNGFVTLIIWAVSTYAIRSIPGAPKEVSLLGPAFFIWTVPILVVSAAIGKWVGSLMAIGAKASQPLLYILHVIIVTVLYLPFNQFLDNQVARANYAMQVCAGIAALSFLVAFVIIIRAVVFDRKLQSLQGGKRGVVLPDKPLELNVTLVGGKSTGKSVFLAAAFYQWERVLSGPIRIVPYRDGREVGGQDEDTDLRAVADSLYGVHSVNDDPRNWFPSGTATTRMYRFKMVYRTDDGDHDVAIFTLLDYPGAAIVGADIGKTLVNQVYEHLEQTDAVLYIADMSAIRRRVIQDQSVRDTFREVLRRVISHGGRHRVVPIGIVYTKCDEFIDPDTGRMTKGEIEQRLREARYDEIVDTWRRESRQNGPGFDRMREFFTAAISHSAPQLDDYDMPDLSLPYMPYEPPAIRPVNCLPPLLWVFSEVIRWNTTATADLSSFFGVNRLTLRQHEAIGELEKLVASKEFEV